MIFFTPTVFLTSLKISCEGPTTPPGESILKTIAFTESSSRNSLISRTISLASVITPDISTTATFSPILKSEPLVPRNMSVSEFADLIYNNHQIEVRSGLHCSILAHHSLGTFPSGSVRFSLSNYHTDNDLLYLYKCIAEIDGRV